MPPEGDVVQTTVVEATVTPIKLEGLEPALVGHFQNRGWDKLPADKVAIEAGKSHMEAQKFIGVPAEQLIRVPAATAPPTEWAPIWQRLGALPKVDDYKATFANFKFANGEAVDDGFASSLADFSFRNHLTKEAAADLPKVIAKYLDENDARVKTVSEAALALEKKTLRESWGTSYEVNEIVAKETAKKLGVAPETVDALESQVGYAGVMKMFHAIASTHGEDIVIPGLTGNTGVKSITKEQAVSRITELKGDKEFAARYLAGGSKEKDEMNALHQIAYGKNAT